SEVLVESAVEVDEPTSRASAAGGTTAATRPDEPTGASVADSSGAALIVTGSARGRAGASLPRCGGRVANSLPATSRFSGSSCGGETASLPPCHRPLSLHYPAAGKPRSNYRLISRRAPAASAREATPPAAPATSTAPGPSVPARRRAAPS